jgi:hypothetical protein
MQLKDKLKFVLPVLSVILLVLSFLQFSDGYQFAGKVVKINQGDIKLVQELSSIKGKSELNTIDKNAQVLDGFLSALFDKFSISNASKDAIVVNGVDKIGEFKDIAVTVKGDFWQQIYFLQQVNKSMREFIVINQLKGNNTQALFNIRIYGRTN